MCGRLLILGGDVVAALVVVEFLLELVARKWG